MKLKTFRHLWGITEPYEQVFPAIKNAGYDGIECVTKDITDSDSFNNLLQSHSFDFIAQVLTVGESVKSHFESFVHLIQQALIYNPVIINSHSGKDSWSFDEKMEFAALAINYEKELGIPIAHETHRSRITYNPWDTRDLLLAFPDLKLCCDFSHWVCVSERLLTGEESIIDLAAERCIHLHARVGYEQGPQVPDPRALEYAAHLQAHENWWDIIWEKQQAKNVEFTTLAPEFGPPPYHHTLPFSNQPVSDVWEICNWMNDRQKERFKNCNYLKNK